MSEEIAGADADIEMIGRDVRFEEREEDGAGGAAPDECICEAEDAEVVEVAEDEGTGVDGCAGAGVGGGHILGGLGWRWR